MVNSKKLIKIVKKWKKLAVLKRKSILMLRLPEDKGHFVIYIVDRKRFMIPLEYLGDRIFSELLKMSEEHFGFPADGPIILPCESLVMEYIILQIARGTSTDLLSSVPSPEGSTSSLSHKGQTMQHLIA